MAEETRSGLSGRHVAVHVCGGIAVVKVPELITALRRHDVEVRVAMTATATSFISPTTLRSLSGHPVAWRLFPPKGRVLAGEKDEESGPGMTHLDLSNWADLHLVVPATASTLARLAAGLADDVVTSTLLATTAPILVAPAMETGMWRNPVTQRNLATLVSGGVQVVGPIEGRLASGRIGAGRMAAPAEILAAVARALQPEGTLRGWKVLVTAGGTREPIYPVRYLGNRSSGRMGECLAQAAAARGAEVHLISAAERVPELPGVATVSVETSEEMLRACLKLLPAVRLVLMAAAVADFRVESPRSSKIHRHQQKELALHLVPTVDILARLTAERPPGCLMVGFAAESEEVVEGGRAKLGQKGCDMIVANPVTGAHSAMGGEMAEATLLLRGGRTVELEWQSKAAIAAAILDEVTALAEEAPPHPLPG